LSFSFPASPSHLPAGPFFAFRLAEEDGGQAALDMSGFESASKDFFPGDPPAAGPNGAFEINRDGTPFDRPLAQESEEEAEEDMVGKVQSLAEYMTLAEELGPGRLFSDSDPPGLDSAEFEELLIKLTSLNIKSDIALHGPKAAAFMSMAEERLISQNDPRALYWLSMVERAPHLEFCPSWLSEMLCLGLAFPLSPPEAAKNRLKHLIEDEAYYKVELLPERHAVLLAAAVIRPSAILCDLELSELSQSLSEHLKSHPPLRDLLIQLSVLSKNSQPLLGPHTMSRTAKLSLLESRKKELDRLTDDWLENAWKKRCIYAQASIVWRHLTERGDLAKLVSECRAGGDEPTLKELRERTSLWRYDDYAFARIEEIHKQNRPRATTVIDFTAKAQLLNMRMDAVNLADSWLAHHHDDREAGSLKGDHYQKNLDLLAKRAAEVLSYLDSLPENFKLQGAGILAPALRELAEKFEGLMEESFVSIDLGAGLTEAEARRYAWLGRIPGLKDPPPAPKLRFGTKTPFLARLTLPAVCLGLTLNEPAYTRVRGQIEDKRFHMASLEIALDPALAGQKPAGGSSDPKKSQARSALKTLLASEGQKSLRLLKDSLSSMKSKIEGSKFWGGLEDEKRDELRVRLRSLERDHAAISGLEEAKLAEPAHACELSELFRDLSDIDLAIHDHLSIATDELEGRLEALKRAIPQGAGDLIESLIKDGELLSAHDQLGLVEESLSLSLPVKAPAPVARLTLAADFYQRLDEIHKIKELQNTKDPLSTLSRIGLRPTREGMEIYSMFASLHPAGERLWDLRALPVILSWLGFKGAESQRFDAPFPAPPLDLAKIVLRGATFESALPKFGSQARSYQILLGYGDIKADDVISMLREASDSPDSPVFVLALSKMAKRSREKLGTLLKNKGLSPVVVDLNLMAYLAGAKPEERTKALIQAGLSQGPYNPYLGEPSALVPPELRFGREDLIERLWERSGPALVHGGRGMGKTVIFNSLVERKRSPQNGCLVSRIVAKPGLSLQELIVEALKKEGLAGGFQNSAFKLADCVTSLFDRSPGQKLERLLIIVEDSDFLLERGKSAQFKQLSNLAALMTETGGRFKIILSGLSAVQRLRHYPDNPFKNFGQPLCVGPLPLSDGHDLVVVPMEALGLTFERAALVQRVLSMANHHPGLIQLFCHALVNFAQAKGTFKITGQDIDEVYAQSAVRKEMVERFDRAIDLDPRYKAAALAVASADLEGEGEGRGGREGQELSVHEILDKAREIWPAAFKEMDADGLESLMLEMRDLGLVRSIFGRHALRSPHVLPLLTGGDDASLALKIFQGRKYDPKPGPEGLRRVIAGEFFPMPSPMVFSQENDLLGWGSGLTLLVGSKALGLDKVREAFKSIEESGELEVKPKIVSLKMMPPAKRLEEIKRIFGQEAKSFGRPALVLVDSLTGLESVEQLPELTGNFWRLIETAAHWLHKTGAGAKASFKVVGLVHPDAWLSKVAEDRSLGDDVDVRFLERLSLSGLEQFLASSALSGAGSKSLLKRTGGWHWLTILELAAKYAPHSPLAADASDFSLLSGPLAPGPPVEACLEVLTVASEAEMAVTFGQLEEEVAALLEKRTGAPAHKRVIRPLLEALARLSLIVPKHPDSDSDPDSEAAWRLDRHYLASLASHS
jgi:hypothetical protein